MEVARKNGETVLAGEAWCYTLTPERRQGPGPARMPGGAAADCD
jgi:hypothetical protein